MAGPSGKRQLVRQVAKGNAATATSKQSRRFIIRSDEQPADIVQVATICVIAWLESQFPQLVKDRPP